MQCLQLMLNISRIFAPVPRLLPTRGVTRRTAQFRHSPGSPFMHITLRSTLRCAAPLAAPTPSRDCFAASTIAGRHWMVNSRATYRQSKLCLCTRLALTTCPIRLDGSAPHAPCEQTEHSAAMSNCAAFQSRRPGKLLLGVGSTKATARFANALCLPTSPLLQFTRQRSSVITDFTSES